MKKVLLALLLALLITTSLGLVSLAADNFVGEKEFAIASFNGVNSFVGKGTKIAELEDAVYWLTDNIETYNIKYVSFVGKIANKCEHSYASVVTAQGKTSTDLITMSLQSSTWRKEYQNFYSAVSPLKDVGIPFGVSGWTTDYVSDGYKRDNLMAEFFALEKIMPDGINHDAYDDNNYVVYVNNNGTNYMVFQLELYPRTAVLDWFKSTVQANLDKYAIVYTTSFLDPTGAMYTMWD